MLNTININLKTDIKTDKPTNLPITLMSQDVNNNQFILRFTNGGESVTLDDSYAVEVLTKFAKSGTSQLTTAKVRQDYATWEFDTAYITQDETVYNYVYVRKSGNLVVSADANCFVFSVDLSEIDKGAGKVAETYDENYQKYLDEFKDNVDFEEIAQAETDRIQAEQARKEAETLREESYEQKVDLAIVEADVVEKVDNKVTELTPQINNLTAQLDQTMTSYEDITKLRVFNISPKIIGYGDSNTRYYLGDQTKEGSRNYSYTSQIDWLARLYPQMFGMEVKNEGHSSKDSTWAVTNFDTYVLNNATVGKPGICVLGFGTNNIKLLSETMESYLSDMETLIKTKCIDNNIVPIVLGIPWFSEGYGDSGSQARLPIWNEELYNLARKHKVPFIDTYNMFKDDPDTYFNEATIKRHFSYHATRILGHKVFDVIRELNGIDTKGMKAEYIEDFTKNLLQSSIYSSTSQYSKFYGEVSLNSFDTFNPFLISQGQSITIKTKGKTCLCFYPRASYTATITGDIEKTLTIDNTDYYSDGVYYPLVRVAKDEEPSNDLTFTITATSGNVYLGGIFSEKSPKISYIKGQLLALTGDRQTISNQAINHRVYFNSELRKEIRYIDGKWYDNSGYQAVGGSTFRYENESVVPKGHTFYDTSQSKKYRFDGTVYVEFT